jgi:hypothetical protein
MSLRGSPWYTFAAVAGAESRSSPESIAATSVCAALPARSYARCGSAQSRRRFSTACCGSFPGYPDAMPGSVALSPAKPRGLRKIIFPVRHLLIISLIGDCRVFLLHRTGIKALDQHSPTCSQR